MIVTEKQYRESVRATESWLSWMWSGAYTLITCCLQGTAPAAHQGEREPGHVDVQHNGGRGPVEASGLAPGMSHEHKETEHRVQDVTEKGVNDSFTTDNEEFRRARDLLDKAMEENAQIDALNKEAYHK